MKYIKRFFHDIKKYRHYISYSVKSNLKAELSNSILGYFWWLLDPMLHMLIYSFVVQFVFKRGDAAFPVYLFCALLPWKVATTAMSNSTGVIRTNAGLIKQIYMPKFLFPLISLLTNSIKLIFGLLILVGMIFVFQIPLSWHIIEFIPLYMVFFLFFWAISLFLTHIGVVFQDMKHLISYLIMFWFFASPTMWYLEMLSDKWQQVMWWNPNTTFFTSMRNIFMDQTSPEYGWLGIWLGISVLLLFTGVVLLYRSEKNYSKAI